MSSTTTTPGRLSLRLDLDSTSAAAVLLLGLQLVVRLVVVLPSYYWQDDFVHLALARQVGLSTDLLIRDHNDHLEIIPSFVYWVLSETTGRSFVPAALLICALQLLVSVLFWRLLRVVLGNRPILLVPLTLYLFTPLALVATTWLAAGLEALTFQAALFGTLLALVRHHREGGVRWAVVSVVAYVLGMLCWEKAALVAPAAAALLVLVVWRHDTLGTAVRRLWQHRWLWAAHAVALAAYLALYLSVVDGSERAAVDAAPYARSAFTLVAQVLVPGLVGGPWHVQGAENTLYPHSGVLLVTACALVLAAVVVASFRVSGKAAVKPWLMAVLYVAGDVGLMLWGRANYLDLVNRDPRYLADAVPVVVLCAAAAFLPDREKEPVDDPHARARLVTASGLLLSSCLLTTFLLAPVVQHTYPRNFVDGLIAEFAGHPGVSVVNTDAPTAIAPLDQRSLLASVGYDATFDQPGLQMYMFDSLAQIRLIDLLNPTLERSGPVPDCGWPIHKKPVEVGTLPASSSRNYVLDLGYVTGVPARLHATVGGSHQTVDVQPGVGHAYFVVNGRSGPIEVNVSRRNQGLCVADVRAGQPWPQG